MRTGHLRDVRVKRGPAPDVGDFDPVPLSEARLFDSSASIGDVYPDRRVRVVADRW